MSTAEPTSPRPSADIEELGKRIRLPVQPAAALWETGVLGAADKDVPGPTDTTLTALLTFRDADVAKVLAEVAKEPRPTYAAIVEARDWFPAEVSRALAGDSAPAGEYRLRDVYDAGPFRKSPFTYGFIGRIGDTSQFLLFLQTM